MKQFLVEVFVPRSRARELPAAKQRVRAAARRLSSSDQEIRYVRAMYVPDDETCFYFLEAASADLITQVSGLADLRDGRVVETVEDSRGGRQ